MKRLVIKDREQEDVNVLSLEYNEDHENIVNIVCNGKVIGCINGCLEIIDWRDYESGY